ncbi:hypothetical protein SAMN05443248_3816 [Bradyrhizobium erythrophlei]|uniref:Uncharacterized protein n=1 Tax=Bradyrhizobium erythrophlei TaxID=1437360 RepID=A0A1M5QHL9_9BRAD|nr:hypothetical protein SAMN05443248_3816 [Bradyrhizobium erythrophlei]
MEENGVKALQLTDPHGLSSDAGVCTGPSSRRAGAISSGLQPLQHALHLHRRPSPAAARGWDTDLVELRCKGPQ